MSFNYSIDFDWYTLSLLQSTLNHKISSENINDKVY